LTTSRWVSASYNFARHYATLLAQMEMDVELGKDAAAVADFEREWLQIRRAHDLALAHRLDDGRLAYDFFMRGAHLRRRRRPSAELEHGGAAALRYARSQGRMIRAQVHLALSKATHQNSRLVRARMHARAAIDLLLAPDGDTLAAETMLVEAHCVLGNVLRDLGHFHEASQAFGEALRRAESIGDERGQGLALGNLGAMQATAGESESALDCFRRATTIARRVGDLDNLMHWLSDTAQLLVTMERVDEATAAATEGLTLAERLGDRQVVGSLRNSLAGVAVMQGDYEKAIDLCTQARDIAEEFRDVPRLSNALMLQGQIEERLGLGNSRDTFARVTDILEGATRFGSAGRARDQITRFLEAREHVNNRLEAVGRIAAAKQARDPVAALESLLADPEIRDVPVLARRVLTEMACVLGRRGDWAAAILRYDESLRADPSLPGQDQVSDSPIDAIVARVNAYDAAVDEFRHPRGVPEHLGLALAALGRFAIDPLASFRTACAALSEAVHLLSQAGFDHLAVLETDLATADTRLRATAAGIGEPLNSAIPKTVVDNELRSLGRRIERQPDLWVRASLLNGAVLYGRPTHLIVGELSLLSIHQDDHLVVVPLEWLSSLRPAPPGFSSAERN
jgi:tetratricopeptide (TPR) repeat protein